MANWSIWIDEINNTVNNNIIEYSNNFFTTNIGYTIGNNYTLKCNNITAGNTTANSYLFTPRKSGLVLITYSQDASNECVVKINGTLISNYSKIVNNCSAIIPVMNNTPYYCTIYNTNSNSGLHANLTNIQIHYDIISYSSNYIFYEADNSNLLYSVNFITNESNPYYININTYGSYYFEVTYNTNAVSEKRIQFDSLNPLYYSWSLQGDNQNITQTFSCWQGPCTIKFSDFGLFTNPTTNWTVNIYAHPITFTENSSYPNVT